MTGKLLVLYGNGTATYILGTHLGPAPQEDEVDTETPPSLTKNKTFNDNVTVSCPI